MERTPSSRDSGVQIGRSHARSVINALGEYQSELESLIESHSLPLGVPQDSAFDADVIVEAQRKWKRAEALVFLLEGALRGDYPDHGLYDAHSPDGGGWRLECFCGFVAQGRKFRQQGQKFDDHLLVERALCAVAS